MDIQGIIFDVGGTLVYSDRGHFMAADTWSAVKFFRSHGFTGPADDLADAIRSALNLRHALEPRQFTLLDALRHATAACDFNPGEALLRDGEKAFFAPETAGAVAIPGMRPLLQRLCGRVRLGVLSNTLSHDLIHRMLDRLDMLPYFDIVVTSVSCGWRKPEPAGFKAILTRWKLAPHQVVMVGDDVAADIDGAHALGIRTFWLCGDVDLERSLKPSHADATGLGVDDLAEALAGWGVKLQPEHAVH